MSKETREVRATVPAAVAERLETAAEVLGASVRRLAGECVEVALEEVVCRHARSRAAELAAFLPPETTIVREADPERKPGRAEKAAAVRTEELREQRRRQRSPSKTPRDPVN